MPEKSKRRKNNKNKRKNKNNRSDGNRNTSSDVKDLGSVESGSVQSLECQENNETSELQSSVENIAEIVQPGTGDLITKVENNLQDECCDQSLQQDLNNNSENSELCDAVVITEDAGIPDSENYIVESPEQSLKSKKKISNNVKSKSLDNDDDTKIVEITEDSGNQCEDDSTMAVIDSNILVSDVESDIEWEKCDEDSTTEPKEVATGTLSITTIPLNVALCEHTKSLTPDEEISLRHYLKTLNLSTHPNVNAIEIKTEIEQIINREIRHRLRKKGLADDFVPSRLGPPRILDVIDEEGSSESSVTSRRQSYLSDKKSDGEELEDDVFEEPQKVIKSTSSKSNTTAKRSHKMIGQLVPQECVLVGAKIKEPEVAEARGDWTMQTVEKMKGAEVVYLTDSSSSTSSIHEIGDDTDNGEDTDVSVRMITPTIEVTDTDNLLKNTFISKSDTNDLQLKLLQNPVQKSEDGGEVLTNRETPPEKNDLNNLETEKSHEIIVSSIDDIKTNLYVKDLEENSKESVTTSEHNSTIPRDKNVAKTNDEYDLEMKVLKCELNDAINNLIKEVCSDSENNENLSNNFVRQDSSSSVGSSSQCTAKYNPTHSSLNDVSNMLHDEMTSGPKLSRDNSQENSHVKDVFECVTGASAQYNVETDQKSIQPSALRDICVRRISTLPYGNKILEELASVSERLQNINSFGTKAIHSSDTLSGDQNNTKNMPNYPLPDVSTIEKVSLPVHQKKPQPPPVQPRNSSLKKSQDDNHWTGVPTEVEPVYVCFSPSQKMLMEKTNTVITKEDATQLADMHKKYVDRRGYNEPYHMKKHEAKDTDDPPIVPFKSQTGSRLLALIRDPTVTSNVNSNSRINSHYTSSYENIRKGNYSSEFISKMKHDGKFANFSTNFKPIPPPRPKKYSSSFYESDESSDFTDSSMRSMRSEKKSFHFSTGNLSKDIENDISSIQNMHRYYTNTRDNLSDYNRPRRPSLPKDLCDQQMEYIRKKEKEVEAEIKRLEQEKLNMSVTHKKGPRAPLIVEKETVVDKHVDDNNVHASRRNDFSVNTQSSEKLNRSKLSSVFSSSQEELLRDKMYSEYVTQMAERQERKQHKIIKITNPSPLSNKTVSKSMSALEILDSKVNNRIEEEFISKARERWNKLGIADPETEDERDKDVYKEPKVIEHKIKVIEGGAETDVQKLPSHLQEFVSFTAKQKEQGASSSAVWRPGAPTPPPAPVPARSPGAPPPPPPPPVWTPGSAAASPQAPRKSFRPVHFEETPPARRKFANSEQNGCTSGSESEGRLRTSHSAPVTGLNNLGGSSTTSRLPKAQNPTVTLLQKAREGQIPRISSYLQQERDAARLPRDRPSPPVGDPVHVLRKEYASESEAERIEYERGARKMAETPRKLEGIGPTTKDGMPVTLRSEVKDPSRWYKKMYDTIHKSKYDDDYVTIRYKNRRGEQPQRVTNKSQYAYFDPRSGYLSEPEGGLSRLGSSTWSDAYDSDVTSGPRRRTASVQEERRISDASSPYLPNNKYSTLASARASQEVYKNQPGRIENYVPGKSSVVDKEAKQWWDEVMDIFDGQNISSTTSLPQASPKDKKDLTSTILSKSNMARALKESGYESDSTLVFRRRDDTEAPLSPAERRAAYRDLQAGGEPPLRGFRSPAPPRTESPRRYLESDVNIHYRCPVRQDPLPLVPERELARQQAEHMKKLYREQRRNKYLQENEIHPADIEAFDASMKELQDMQNRRHQDNFTPSQKNILPLNRYDEAERIVARALYAFNGQTAKELSFRKGDLIHVRRQIDSNWYEGEIHGRIGLFPYNYVEIMKGEVAHSPKKPAVLEGRARAKFDFTAQTNLELPLKKGEVVVLTRRIDQNWWEGRNGSKTGIFPDSYVTILQEPSQSKPDSHPIMNENKPVASPAAHGLLNGTAKRSMGAHSYMPQPNNPALANAPPATQPLPGYVAKPAQARLSASERGYGPPSGAGVDLNNTEPLYVDTNAEAVPYRAMYKYRPQNPDELELNEGDTVYVLEKCDDGWYVGSSQRTGRFGTFPGNYVERI